MHYCSNHHRDIYHHVTNNQQSTTKAHLNNQLNCHRQVASTCRRQAVESLSRGDQVGCGTGHFGTAECVLGLAGRSRRRPRHFRRHLGYVEVKLHSQNKTPSPYPLTASVRTLGIRICPMHICKLDRERDREECGWVMSNFGTNTGIKVRPWHLINCLFDWVRCRLSQSHSFSYCRYTETKNTRQRTLRCKSI